MHANEACRLDRYVLPAETHAYDKPTLDGKMHFYIWMSMQNALKTIAVICMDLYGDPDSLNFDSSCSAAHTGWTYSKYKMAIPFIYHIIAQET